MKKEKDGVKWEKVECGWRAVTQTGTSGAGEGPEAVLAVLFWLS